MKYSLLLLIVITNIMFTGMSVAAQDPWPWNAPINLTHIEGPEPNDFYYDLSGAFWNPITRVLWVCRNGPGGTNSKLWAIIEDGNGSFEIDYQAGYRGEWTGFGDFEGISQADYSENIVYGIIEDEQVIREYDLSTYGLFVINNSWNISAYIPTSGGSGAEGITFVPDDSLSAGGFVDANGLPYISSNGMNGLMFVAHQNGGRIYVFDLDRSNGAFIFVGEYSTAFTESAGLEFDRSTHLLYIWHGGIFNKLEMSELSSDLNGAYRKFTEVIIYDQPHSGNLEGFARTQSNEPDSWVFLTIDDGNSNSLDWFQLCINSGDVNCSGNLTAEDAQITFNITLGLIEPSQREECAADCDGNGTVSTDDAQMIFFCALGITEECADRSFML
ncbi:hypothetical protein K8T06_10920 [bacterium]|nr:hypothetical protein [bacterium]